MARKIGFTIIILQIFALTAIQFALATNTVREVFTPIDRMEGFAASGAIIDNIGTIEIELKAVPDGNIDNIQENNLRILVNGRIAGYFDDTMSLSLAVRNNSLIEIDAVNEPNQFRITVSHISDNALDISRYMEVVTNQNIAILGKVFAQ